MTLAPWHPEDIWERGFNADLVEKAQSESDEPMIQMNTLQAQFDTALELGDIDAMAEIVDAQIEINRRLIHEGLQAITDYYNNGGVPPFDFSPFIFRAEEIPAWTHL